MSVGAEAAGRDREPENLWSHPGFSAASPAGAGCVQRPHNHSSAGAPRFTLILIYRHKAGHIGTNPPLPNRKEAAARRAFHTTRRPAGYASPCASRGPEIDEGATLGSNEAPHSQAGDTRDPRRSVAHRLVAKRFGRADAFGTPSPAGPVLRLTHRQRDLLRKGMKELQSYCGDDALWRAAADEAESAQRDLNIPDLAPGFIMWTTNTAAIAAGAWWLLMPGCGAPALQATMCAYLRVPWLERRPDYARLVEALNEGRYPTMKQVLEWTERVRCALMINVREG